MKTKLIKFFKISLPIAIGLYLTWYFISNSTDDEKEYFVQSLSEAKYGWIFCALTIAFLSHLSRAYRWKYLLETLDIKPKLSLMYHKLFYFPSLFWRNLQSLQLFHWYNLISYLPSLVLKNQIYINGTNVFNTLSYYSFCKFDIVDYI